jgi:hypothetical protein
LRGSIAAVSTSPRFRRRDFLGFGVAGVGILVGVKVVGRVVIGVEPTGREGPPLQHLSERHAATVVAAVGPMLGAQAEDARVRGRWDPAAAVDRFFDLMAPDQRQLLGVALTLLEEWTVGLRGFSKQDAAGRAAWLEAWRVGSLPVHRSTWGFLHAALAAAWAATPDGWEQLGYPGPCVASVGHAGRMPGQSVSFDWDESVQ